MTTPELLPCPFCGATQPPHDDTSWIRCSECGAETGWRADGAGAIAAWNRRTTSPEVAALIAEARREERERCARVVEKRAEAYDREFGIYDYSTGITEYPGTGSESMEEWEDIAAAIRAMKEETP